MNILLKRISAAENEAMIMTATAIAELTSGRFSHADAFEAVLAAVYLDGGMEEASKIALRFVARHDFLDDSKDYKTILQEVVQRNREEHVEYVIVGESGPAHSRVFTVEVHLNSNVIGKGEGKSKKNAEQMAAKEALALMGIK